jgi:hypothetical protein
MRRMLTAASASASPVEKAARFDLDESDLPAAPDDEVDLANRRFHAAGDDAVELCLEEQRGPELAAAAGGLIKLPELIGRL